MLYTAIRETLNSKPSIIPADEPYQCSPEKDYYSSLFLYSEDHKKIFEEKGTLAGIKDTTTNRLYFDFDSASNLEAAREDAVNLAIKLVNMGVQEDAIRTSFSGAKGYVVELTLDRYVTPEQFKKAVFNLAEEYTTFDRVVNDPNRIVRLLNTKHQKSGLYKIPLTATEIMEKTSEEIKSMASNPKILSTPIIPVSLPDSLFIDAEIANVIPINPSEVDFSKKAKGWSNCKWSLLNGNFTEGGRHYPILAILATCKALNYPKETAYYMAKSASKLSAQKNGGSEYSKEEIWRQTEDVYGETWTGGAFSCKTGKDIWLTEICNKLGPHKCKAEDERVFSDLGELSSIFNRFATDIEKNKIKTGIKELDDSVTLCTSTLVGILGNPGAGKTTLSLNILNNCSKNNIPSIFFSLDMGIPLVYLKLIQKHTGLSNEKAFDIFKNDKVEADRIAKIIEENYGGVKFCFKSGMNVEAIRESIISHQEKSGQKVKLVVVDYLECIAGPYSDSTANTAIIANKLKDLANETETCILLLLQTQKHSSAPDEPLLSLKNIKGSSVIEQAASVVISLWREGYSPKYSSYDRFISMATVKDRFASLWKYDFRWDGLRGTISELSDLDQDDLEKLRELKRQDKLSVSRNEFDF